MKAETKWNCGNFAVELVASADEKQTQALVNLGLRFLGQRVTKVDKILGAFEKKGGKDVRKAGWKRNDVNYSASLADELALAFAELEFPDEADGKITCGVVVSEYVPTTAEPKFKREIEKLGQKESAGVLVEWLASFCKYTGPTHTEDGEEFHPDALAAAKVAITEFLKNA